jgi:hypothetical protein
MVCVMRLHGGVHVPLFCAHVIGPSTGRDVPIGSQQNPTLAWLHLMGEGGV